MTIENQIKQIEALRDKAISSCERATAQAERYRKEADEFSIAIDVLKRLHPMDEASDGAPQREKLPATPQGAKPIGGRILDVMKASDKTWWTANELQDALSQTGNYVKMTSISPNLTRLKESGDIVRDDLKVALADRAPQKTEAPEDDLLSGNSSGASNDHGLTSRGTQPSSPVEPWAGGGT